MIKITSLVAALACYVGASLLDVSYTTECLYSGAHERYDSSCVPVGTADVMFECTAATDSNQLTCTLDGVRYVIDSAKSAVNSRGDSITQAYGQEETTRQARTIVAARTYVNVAAPGYWLRSYVISGAGGYIQGTGFGVSSRYLVTNAHVVAHLRSVVVKIGDNYSAAKVQHVDTSLDLAVLTVDSGVKACALDDSVRAIGSEIIAYGFPRVETQGTSIKATKGIISSKFGYMDDVKTYQIDAAVQHGNSGGPLMVGNKVVGVIVSSLTDGQNVNYAIKSVFVSAFLRAAGIKSFGARKPHECTYMLFGEREQ